jgi:hypothetical protein
VGAAGTTRRIAALGTILCGLAGCAEIGEPPPGAGAPLPGGDASPGDTPVQGGEVPQQPALPFRPSNFDPELLAGVTAALLLEASPTGVFFFDTDTGLLSTSAGGASIRPAGVLLASVDQGPGAPPATVLAATEIRLGAGQLLQVKGSAALILVALGDLTLDGRIDASGGRDRPEQPGPGGHAGGVRGAPGGGGPGGGKHNGAADVGGGGGGHAGAGGAGGARGSITGGAGGSKAGTATLVPLTGGAGGARGGDGDDSGPGNGGGGGGAVQLVAFAALRVNATGGVQCGGGGGQGGSGDDAGGGGGAGGGILLEAMTLSVDGFLAANGGSGGAGANGNDRGASGLSGGTGASPSAGAPGQGEGGSGGAGGATGQVDGATGSSVTGVENQADNAGGGGGAGGYIHLRSKAPAQLGGVISPAEGLGQALIP